MAKNKNTNCCFFTNSELKNLDKTTTMEQMHRKKNPILSPSNLKDEAAAYHEQIN